MKKVLLTAAVALICAAPAQAATTSTLRARVVYMQRVMGVPVTTAAYPGWQGWIQLHPRNIQQEEQRWRWRARVLSYAFAHPPHKNAWLCIHHYEGSWRDPSPPYWGGIQMDRSFMRSYGGFLYRLKGTADHWSPLEQMWAGERALRAGRGFTPWPNTARYCGLL